MNGEVTYFYAFDVGNEILPARLGLVLGHRPEPLKFHLKHSAPKDVAFQPPLTVVPGGLNLKLNGRTVVSSVHIYHVGVVSIGFRVPFTHMDVNGLLPLHRPILDDNRPLDAAARAICDDVRRQVADAVVQLVENPTDPEAYTVFRITGLGDQAATDWLASERSQVAGLLCGIAPNRLSDAQIAETLRMQWSLEKDDLVVIDWDAALVVESHNPSDDVLFVLEVANLQLEEFRVMDRTIDRYLDRAYEDLERRRTVRLFGSTATVLRHLRRFRVDLTKLADEVTNITKFVGDWYLARVYLGARERFHLDRWRRSIDERLGQLDQLYSVVQSELFERRLLWLEIIMAVFFAIDLLAILVFKR
jgi:hypothetical protein